MATPNNVLSSAIHLADRGFFVFRVNGHNKVPYASGWQNEALSTEPEQLDWENKNVGVFTERLEDGRYLCVIDVDVKNGKNGLETVENLALQEGLIFPQTYTVKTPSGGYHYYYVSDKPHSLSVEKLGRGIDVRSSGGYVLGEGSKGYEVIHNLPLSELPAWVDARLSAPMFSVAGRDLPPRGVEISSDGILSRAKSYLIHNAPKAVEGSGGNMTTYSVAVQLRDMGVGEFDALWLMTEHWNERKALPNWSFEELEVIVGNAYNYAKQQIGNASPKAEFEIPPSVNDLKDEASIFHLKCFRDDEAWPTTEGLYLVDHLLMQKSFSMMIGESNVGKTFIALDLAYHIVCGKPWRGFKVKPFSVLYIATEGTQGIRNRIVGVKRHYPEYETGPNYIYVIYQSVDFYTNNNHLKEIKKFMLEIEERDSCRFGMVIVDTLSRALAGGNENSPDDIGKVIARFDHLRDAMNVHVMLVHHKGKDMSRGGRGHSKLGCDIDTVIDIVGVTGDTGVIQLPKQKDDMKISALGFKRITKEIGKREEDGEPITTCAIDECKVTAITDFEEGGLKLGENEKLALRALDAASETGGEIVPGSDLENPKHKVKDALWRASFVEMYGINNASARSAYSRAKKSLTIKDLVVHMGKEEWSYVGS